MSYDPLSSKTEQYTVPSVICELKDRAARTRVLTAKDLGILRLQQPSERAKKSVESTSTGLGDRRRLSPTDRDVLALCLDLTALRRQCILVTDDYSIQNVAEHLGIQFRTLTTRGIRYRFHWILYCPGCGRTYRSNLESRVCTICGTELKRKVSEKTRVQKT